jgi:hypothetical protein
MTPDNVALIWEDIEHQAEAGFIRVVSESVLFRGSQISRVVVVPQANRRGRIILNLSGEADMGVERATSQNNTVSLGSFSNVPFQQEFHLATTTHLKTVVLTAML